MSEGKKRDGSFTKAFSKLAFDAQEALLSKLNGMYESAKTSRAAELMAELSRLGVAPSKKRGRPAKTADGATSGKGRRHHALAGKSLSAKYRSKVDPSLKWAAGMMPKWMKGTKRKKEDFAI